MDLTVLDSWWRLNDTLCPSCGRPLAVHDGQTPADYHTGYNECPAAMALESAQAAKAAEDDQARDAARRRKDDAAARIDPSRARTWSAWTDTEGEPD